MARHDSEDHHPEKTTAHSEGDFFNEIPSDDESSCHYIRSAQESGNEEAWELIYGRYYMRALLYAELKLGPQLRKQHSAEDLIQEVFLRLVKAIDQFEYRGKDSFFAWLCQHIRWVAASWGRQGRPRVIEPHFTDTSAADPLEKMSTNKPGPRTLVGGQDVVAMLRKSLEKIPDLYREVLVEVLIEGQDRAVVALRRGEKLETLRKQINRGLEKWRESLGGLDPADYLG